jgi:trk system potassium uptake protein TrkH
VCLIAIDLAKDTFALTGSLTENIGISLRDSAFQVAAVMTSTGFSSVDYGGWSEFAQTLMLVVMCTGACAGSTAGGIKISRIILYIKSIGKELEFQLHPRSVRKIKMDGKTIEHETLRSTKAFLLIYILVAIVSLILISLDQFDFTTNFTATIAMLNDVGPGFGAAGPTENYGKFSALSKCVMMFDMLAGRLEVVPVIVLLTPGTWKRQ